MKKKNFSVHDHGLWDDVARSIRPLGKSALKLGAVSMPNPAITFVPPKPVAPKMAIKKSPPPITGFDRRTEQKLMRGKVEIESRLDLHGMNLEDAFWISSPTAACKASVSCWSSQARVHRPLPATRSMAATISTLRSAKVACVEACRTGCTKRSSEPMSLASSPPIPSTAAAALFM
jgi:hypothetical protein